MKIGLFFGSFNPIHNGHLILANHLVHYTDYEQVWFVVSPQNPFKKKSTLLDEHHRLYMVNLAIEQDQRFRSSSIEFSLEQPSYTAITLSHFREKYPQHEFGIFMGEDNLNHLHKWKNAESIIDNHPVVCYPRIDSNNKQNKEFVKKVRLTICDAPIVNISSSYVRKLVADGGEAKYVVTDSVWQYIDEMNFYK